MEKDKDDKNIETAAAIGLPIGILVLIFGIMCIPITSGKDWIGTIMIILAGLSLIVAFCVVAYRKQGK